MGKRTWWDRTAEKLTIAFIVCLPVIFIAVFIWWQVALIHYCWNQEGSGIICYMDHLPAN